MTNRVLIIALAEKWTGISRLPEGLRRANFEVYALCPRKSFLAKTRFLNSFWTYPTFTYNRSKIIYLYILMAIIYFKPQVLIAGDEEAVLALQNICIILDKLFLKSFSNKIKKWVQQNEFSNVILSKSKFINCCNEWGLPAPKNIKIATLDEALSVAPSLGYPLVLKFDFGYGASGVTICFNQEDLRKGFKQKNTASYKQKIKGSIKKLLFVVQNETENGVSLQQYISGQVGHSPFCALDGKVFAINPMLKFKTHPGPTGPSSVNKGINSIDLKNDVIKFANNIKYSGFGSLEYIIDEKTQRHYFIEMNPRPVPVSHFGFDHCAVDLCDSLYKGLNGLAIEEKEFKPFIVALFPNELKRDPQSRYLTEGYHDIPKNDPVLMKALIGE